MLYCFAVPLTQSTPVILNGGKAKSFIFLQLLAFCLFFLIFDEKKARAGKLAENQELKSESPRILGHSV